MIKILKLITIILAAGKGNRMKDLSKPKVLHELNHRPMIDYVIDQAINVKSDQIIIVVGYKKNMIIEHVLKYYSDKNIIFIDQLQQLGTGHAVLQTKDILKFYNNDILILMGDAPLISHETILELIKFHKCDNYIASILTKITNRPQNYGRIIRNDSGTFFKTIEKADIINYPQYSNIKEVNTGVCIFSSKHLFRCLKKVTNLNNQYEYYLPDVFNILANEDKKVGVYCSHDIPNIHGINTKKQLNAAQKFFKKNPHLI